MNEICLREAVLRLEMLEQIYGVNPNIKKYLKAGRLYYSYVTGGGYIGSIDTIGYDARYAEAARRFERETGCPVYHAIEHKSTLALLYVGTDEASWPGERPTAAGVRACVVDIPTGQKKEGYVRLDVLQGALRLRDSKVWPALPGGRKMTGEDEEALRRLDILREAGLTTDLDLKAIYADESEICFSEGREIFGLEVYVLDRITMCPEYARRTEEYTQQLQAKLYFMMVTADKKLVWLYVDRSESTWNRQRSDLKDCETMALVYDPKTDKADFMRVAWQMVNGGPKCRVTGKDDTVNA